MDRIEQRPMVWDCHQNLSRLFYYLDEGRDPDLAKLFAADGVSHRQGRALKGRDRFESAEWC